jgi:hypothetical protein
MVGGKMTGARRRLPWPNFHKKELQIPPPEPITAQYEKGTDQMSLAPGFGSINTVGGNSAIPL